MMIRENVVENGISRNRFLKRLLGSGIALVAGAAYGERLFAQNQKRPRKPPYDPELVKEFVTAGHTDIEKTARMLESHPNLLNSAWDWGGGDFETAIGGAGHMGNADIAEFLIGKGARVNLFVLTMLGRRELVEPVLESYPTLITAKGPHGFSLLHHAQKGGDRSVPLVEYLTAKGLTETSFPL